MPELPEVETMCRGIRPLCGRRLVRIRSLPCRAKPLAITPRLAVIGRRLKQRQFERCSRLGKRVVFEFTGGQRLVFEPRMTGLVLLADPPTREHLRIELLLDGPAPNRIWMWDRRGLGTLRWYSPAAWLEFLEGRGVGPDALTISRTEFETRVGCARSAIKVALMDQRRLAGIGNLYAAEILHQACIDPRRPANELSAEEWRQLWKSMRTILNDAISYEGSTLGDGTYRNALNQPGSYQNHHAVYGRVDEPCPRCRQGIVTRIVQNQRSTFYCPRCQH